MSDVSDVRFARSFMENLPGQSPELVFHPLSPRAMMGWSSETILKPLQPSDAETENSLPHMFALSPHVASLMETSSSEMVQTDFKIPSPFGSPVRDRHPNTKSRTAAFPLTSASTSPSTATPTTSLNSMGTSMLTTTAMSSTLQEAFSINGKVPLSLPLSLTCVLLPFFLWFFVSPISVNTYTEPMAAARVKKQADHVENRLHFSEGPFYYFMVNRGSFAGPDEHKKILHGWVNKSSPTNPLQCKAHLGEQVVFMTQAELKEKKLPPKPKQVKNETDKAFKWRYQLWEWHRVGKKYTPAAAGAHRCQQSASLSGIYCADHLKSIHWLAIAPSTHLNQFGIGGFGLFAAHDGDDDRDVFMKGKKAKRNSSPGEVIYYYEGEDLNELELDARYDYITDSINLTQDEVDDNNILESVEEPGRYLISPTGPYITANDTITKGNFIDAAIMRGPAAYSNDFHVPPWADAKWKQAALRPRENTISKIGRQGTRARLEAHDRAIVDGSELLTNYGNTRKDNSYFSGLNTKFIHFTTVTVDDAKDYNLDDIKAAFVEESKSAKYVDLSTIDGRVGKKKTKKKKAAVGKGQKRKATCTSTSSRLERNVFNASLIDLDDRIPPPSHSNSSSSSSSSSFASRLQEGRTQAQRSGGGLLGRRLQHR